MAKDSRFAEIYRQQLMKDKGILGAFASTAGERGKEIVDLRKMLPKSGISGAISQRLFGKAYRSGSVSDRGESTRITRVDMNSQLTARNTSVLPAMAREMNLTRLNMQKLVKLAGGTPSKTSTFVKDKGVSGPSSSVGKTVGGIGSAAGGILGGLFSALGGLGGGLISIGSSLLSGVVGLLGSAGGAIFKVIGGALMAMGPIGVILAAGVAYLLYEFTKNVDFGEIGSSIKKFFTSGDFLNSLYGGAEKVDKFLGVDFFTPMLDSLVSTFVNMHNRIVDFTALAKAEIEIMGGNVVTIVKDMATNVAAILLGAAGLRAASDIILSPDVSGAPDTSGGSDKKGGNPGRRGPRGGLRGAVRTLPVPAGTGYPGAAGALVTAPRAAAQTAGAAISSRIGLSAVKIAGGWVLRTAGFFLGGPVGWVLGIGLTLYQLKDILKDSDIKKSDIDQLVTDGLLAPEDAETLKDLVDMEQIKSELKKPNLPASDIVDLTARLKAHEQKGTESAAQNIIDRYKDTNQNNRLDSDDIIRARALEGARKNHMTMPTRTNANSPTKITANNLQELIGSKESIGGSYDSVNLGQAGGYKGKLWEGLSDYTVEQVLAMQKAKRFNAAGKYQIIPSTLQGLLGQGVVNKTDKFNEETQDKLFAALVAGRESAAKGDTSEFLYGLSKEFASVAVPAGMQLESGKISSGVESYYDKSAGGINKAHILPSQILSALGKSADSLSPNKQEESVMDKMIAGIAGLLQVSQDTNKQIQAVAAASSKGSESSSSMIESPYDREAFDSLFRYHADIHSSST